MKKLLLNLLLFQLIFNIFAIDDYISWNIKNNFENNIYLKKNIEKEQINDIPVYYRIKELKYVPDNNTDLYLSFNENDNSTNTKNYRILYKKNFLSDNKSVYKQSAFFIGENQKIELIGTNNSFFQSGVNLDSFTISFWIYPSSYSSNETIVRIGSQFYNNETDKIEDQSLNAKLLNGRLVWEFNNIFYNEFGENRTITIESYNRIIPEKWTHVNLTYNNYSGIIKVYINGIEEGIVIANDNSSLDSTAFNLKFHEKNRCVIVLAPSYYGGIDEFCIVKNIQNNYFSKFNPDGGELISKVIDFGAGGNYINSIEIDKLTENNSDINVYFRYSNSPFNAQNAELNWLLFDETTNLPDYPIRFFQWRVLFLAGDDANFSPKLKGIKIQYKKNIPPSIPKGIRILACDNKIKIKWKLNSEHDLKGYKLYYGTKTGVYFCKDANEGESPIDVGLNTNFELTGLNKNIIYYIVLTAYDDIDHIHESDFSDEISERPFGLCIE